MDFPLKDTIEPTYRLAVNETGGVQTATDGSVIVVDIESSALYRLPNCPIVWQHFGITESQESTERQDSTERQERTERQGNIQNIVQEQSEERKARKAERWSHRDTLQLISEWSSRRTRFENNIETNESLWEEVATSLGANYTALRCENRFKYLKRLYMETKDKNNRMTGGPEVSCPYYDEFDELFAQSPQVNPPALVSNRDPPSNPYPLSPPSPLEEMDVNIIDDNLTDSSSVGPHRRRRRRTRLDTEMSRWVMEMRDEARLREDARERRHQEILRLQRETNVLYKDMMTKLIEKL